MAQCTHKDHIHNVQPQPQGACKECLEEGTKWAQLRMCLECGHVGCCDSSPGKHATRHFETTKHPVMQAHTGGNWKWCYVDKTYV
jgi:monovalent cation:H+ antiporter-2, CPA2 family